MIPAFSTLLQTPVLADSSVVTYFVQSNFAGQVIVVILVVFSVVAWGAMLCKNADLNAMDTANKNAQLRLSKSNSLQEAAASKNISGPDATLMRDAVAEWERSGYGLDDSVESRSIRMGHVENALQRTLARQVIKCESKMTLLGTIISGAPFLGLLGTAWGVMDCFGSMSAQASVTLNDLAPGVAGALLTTVAGLLVAIPSVFGYNYLSTRTRKAVTDMENFASLLADRLELESRARELNSRSAQQRLQTPPQYPTAPQSAYAQSAYAQAPNGYAQSAQAQFGQAPFSQPAFERSAPQAPGQAAPVFASNSATANFTAPGQNAAIPTPIYPNSPLPPEPRAERKIPQADIPQAGGAQPGIIQAGVAQAGVMPSGAAQAGGAQNGAQDSARAAPFEPQSSPFPAGALPSDPAPANAPEEIAENAAAPQPPKAPGRVIKFSIDDDDDDSDSPAPSRNFD